MKKSPGLILLMTLYRITLNAQSDFVVTNKNDTIYGRVSTTTWNGFTTGDVKIKPRQGANTSKQTFTPNEARGFSKGGAIFESLALEPIHSAATPERIFAERIVEGHLNLYKEEKIIADRPGMAGREVVTYYFKKSGEPFASKARANKKKLIEYFKDCQVLQEDLTDEFVKPKDFETITKTYNSHCSAK